MSVKTFSDIKLPVTATEQELLAIAKKKLGAQPQYFAIRKKSLDARDKNNLRYVYTVECSAKPYCEKTVPLECLAKDKMPKERVLVVGSGPAGLFCAIRLLERGILPLVIERGAAVEEREQSIERFFSTRVLDTQSNVQFGEGEQVRFRTES